MTLHEAHMLWSPEIAGWLLFYRGGGVNPPLLIEEDIGETQDASIESLAFQTAGVVADDASGQVKVYRHDRLAGEFTLDGGHVVAWRAL